MVTESSYLSVEEAAAAVASTIASILDQSISERGKAFMAVSGGRTPKVVFERLREYDLGWDKVIVTLTDERWVNVDQHQSNERLARTCLLQDSGKAAEFIPLYDGRASPEAALEACESRLLSLEMQLDVVYLGMGTDGHTASLFPGATFKYGSQSLCVAVSNAPDGLARLSLSVDAIVSSRNIVLLYSGADKHEAYVSAKANDAIPGNPLSHILSQHETPVYVFRASGS